MWPFLNNVTSSCEQNYCTSASSICYKGYNLSCIGVNQNDTLSVALQKINALMCEPISSVEIIETLGYVPANDSTVVHKTGDETIDGVKSFNSTPKFNSGSINILDGANGDYASINVSDSVFGVVDHGGNVQFSAETGVKFTTYKTNTIAANFLLAELTQTRSYTLPNATGTIALDENVVHKTGNETINGIKDFTNYILVSSISSNSGQLVLASGGTQLSINDIDEQIIANREFIAPQYKLSVLNTAPATATSTGTLGDIRVTATHIYVCIATNTWVRTALTTWT